MIHPSAPVSRLTTRLHATREQLDASRAAEAEARASLAQQHAEAAADRAALATELAASQARPVRLTLASLTPYLTRTIPHHVALPRLPSIQSVICDTKAALAAKVAELSAAEARGTGLEQARAAAAAAADEVSAMRGIVRDALAALASVAAAHSRPDAMPVALTRDVGAALLTALGAVRERISGNSGTCRSGLSTESRTSLLAAADDALAYARHGGGSGHATAATQTTRRHEPSLPQPQRGAQQRANAVSASNSEDNFDSLAVERLRAQLAAAQHEATTARAAAAAATKSLTDMRWRAIAHGVPPSALADAAGPVPTQPETPPSQVAPPSHVVQSQQAVPRMVPQSALHAAMRSDAATPADHPQATANLGASDVTPAHSAADHRGASADPVVVATPRASLPPQHTRPHVNAKTAAATAAAMAPVGVSTSVAPDTARGPLGGASFADAISAALKPTRRAAVVAL